VPPAVIVSGKVAPERAKPVPLIVPALIVSGAVPVEESEIVRVEVVFCVTLPKLRLVALMLSVATDAFKVRG
jgi:hypothetical protein